jgi:hypothetical protein
MGSIVGLDYSAVDFMLKLYEYKDGKKIFGDMQMIERGALKVFFERPAAGAKDGA